MRRSTFLIVASTALVVGMLLLSRATRTSLGTRAVLPAVNSESSEATALAQDANRLVVPPVDDRRTAVDVATVALEPSASRSRSTTATTHLEVELFGAMAGATRITAHAGSTPNEPLLAEVWTDEDRAFLEVASESSTELLIVATSEGGSGWCRVRRDSRRVRLELHAHGIISGRILGLAADANAMDVQWRTTGELWAGSGSVRADNRGFFSIPDLRAANYELTAIGTIDPVRVTLTPGEHVTDAELLAMQGQGRIRGTVVDASGAPVPRARVLARLSRAPTSAMAMHRAIADKSGQFDVAVAQEEPYLLSALVAGAGLLARPGAAQPAEPGDVSVTLVTPPPASEVVRGVVRFPDGASRALVVVEHRGGIAQSFATEGPFEVKGVAEGPARLRLSGARVVDFEQELEVVPGGRNDIGTIDLVSLGAVHFLVTDVQGRPLADVGLYRLPATDFGLRVTSAHQPLARTDAQGRSTLHLAGGLPVRVVAWAPGMTSAPVTIGDDRTGDEVRITLAPGADLKLVGLAVVTGDHLVWRARIEEAATSKLVSASVFHREAQALSFPGLAPGQYVVHLEALDDLDAHVVETKSFPLTLADATKHTVRVPSSHPEFPR